MGVSGIAAAQSTSVPAQPDPALAGQASTKTPAGVGNPTQRPDGTDPASRDAVKTGSSCPQQEQSRITPCRRASATTTVNHQPNAMPQPAPRRRSPRQEVSLADRRVKPRFGEKGERPEVPTNPTGKGRPVRRSNVAARHQDKKRPATPWRCGPLLAWRSALGWRSCRMAMLAAVLTEARHRLGVEGLLLFRRQRCIEAARDICTLGEIAVRSAWRADVTRGFYATLTQQYVTALYFVQLRIAKARGRNRFPARARARRETHPARACSHPRRRARRGVRPRRAGSRHGAATPRTRPRPAASRPVR